MPKVKMNEEQFLKIFKEVEKATDIFKNIRADIFENDPTRIRVFRMLTGLGLEKFAKRFGKNYNTISQYEIGEIKRIRKKEAERIARILLEILPHNPSKELALENFRKMKEIANGGATQAFSRAEKASLTASEKNIRDVIEKSGRKFEVHKTLQTSSGPFNFDFLVDEKFLIECTASDSIQKAEALGFRALKLKESFPHLKKIVIVPEKISNGVKRRLSDFDKIIFLNKLEELETVLE